MRDAKSKWENLEKKLPMTRYRLQSYAAMVGSCFAYQAFAQDYPNRPVSLIVASTPGGGIDTIARALAPRLRQGLNGQPFIVENRAGAAQSLATDRVAKSPADGHTLLMITSSIITTSVLRLDLPYNLERDLAPVTLLAIGPMVVVAHPSVPAGNVKELIALARSRPGRLTYSTGGVGNTAHVAAEIFSNMAKVKLLHVPYKASPEALIGVVAGEVDINLTGVQLALPLVAAGRLRALAVTSKQRSMFLPSVLTLNEAGVPGYEWTPWYGMLAPAAVPRNILMQLNTMTNRILNTPEMKEALAQQGIEPQTSTPERFSALIHNDLAQFSTLAKSLGLKAE